MLPDCWSSSFWLLANSRNRENAKRRLYLLPFPEALNATETPTVVEVKSYSVPAATDAATAVTAELQFTKIETRSFTKFDRCIDASACAATAAAIQKLNAIVATNPETFCAQL